MCVFVLALRKSQWQLSAASRHSEAILGKHGQFGTIVLLRVITKTLLFLGKLCIVDGVPLLNTPQRFVLEVSFATMHADLLVFLHKHAYFLSFAAPCKHRGLSRAGLGSCRLTAHIGNHCLMVRMSEDVCP